MNQVYGHQGIPLTVKMKSTRKCISTKQRISSYEYCSAWALSYQHGLMEIMNDWEMNHLLNLVLDTTHLLLHNHFHAKCKFIRSAGQQGI